MPSPVPWKAVDETFSPGTDLYKDILGVQANASTEQIHAAFLTQRRKVLRQLENCRSLQEGRTLERKLDAVVVTARVLEDSGMRGAYDDIRAERLRQARRNRVRDVAKTALRGGSKKQPQITVEDPEADPETGAPLCSFDRNALSDRRRKLRRLRRSKSRDRNETDQLQRQPLRSKSNAEESRQGTPPPLMSQSSSPPPDREALNQSSESSISTNQAKLITPEKTQTRPLKQALLSALRPNKNTSNRKSAAAAASARTPNRVVIQEDLNETATASTMWDDTVHNETLDTTWNDQSTVLTTDSYFSRRGGIVERIQDEVYGVLEDTTSSLSQVLNAFTLQEEEIQAVMLRIDKCKLQFDDL